MLRKGYVETQIEMLSKAIAGILLRKNEGDYNSAITEIRFAGQRMTGFDPTVLAALADEALIDLFWFNNKFDGAKCYMAGCLLAEQADACEGLRKSRLATSSIRKSRILLMEALIHEEVLRNGDVITRISALTSKLDNEPDSPSELRRCCKYHESIGEYAKAEDYLFEYRTDTDPQWKAEADEFYQRLLAAPDDALERGGLPRDEVKSGLEEIRGL